MYELNLVPYELRAKRKKKQFTKKVVSIGGIVVLAFAVLVLIPNIIIMILKGVEASYNNKINSNVAVVTKYNNLKEQIEKENSYLKMVKSFKKKDEDGLVKKIIGFGKFVPADVSFENFTYSKVEIKFTAVTKNYKSIALCLAKLETEPGYKDIRMGQITCDEKNMFNFDVTISTLAKTTESRGGK